MRIVIADDHAMVREGLRPFVENVAPETTVFEAASFEDALAAVHAHRPVNMVILDLRMPGMNGFEGLTDMRRVHPHTRCVILSAFADPEHVFEAMNRGADGFIPKHLSGAAMTSALRLVASGERFMPSSALNGTAPRRSAGDITTRLTRREQDIVRLLREGLPNKVIAARLDVSEVTVKSHLGNVFRKLGVHNRLQAMRMLMDNGWTT
ncbi:response regulator transcription factor [Magnetospirillum sp. UT-4]|uniref:response regulator n=1 Tax=Magnetospirillum sp. UT-4 TaxID=2681467 RepID=UPI001382F289|nr:response regulator transcription factor [Magnetospirillum sp. UT-4]CAA7627103.1 putative Glycerol metabolism activator [Magnetospirillum sp. UT-4]